MANTIGSQAPPTDTNAMVEDSKKEHATYTPSSIEQST